LQAGHGNQVVTLVIEKEQARALAEAIREILKDLNERFPEATEVDISKLDMSLRDPIEPLFRIAQMGLGYDEDSNLVLLVAQELVVAEEEEQESELLEPQVVRIWATREQMHALSEHAESIVKKGRADPKSNGHLIYYWT
jgi:uncharacterized repeat protein (TIGR03847 family)